MTRRVSPSQSIFAPSVVVDGTNHLIARKRGRPLCGAEKTDNSKEFEPATHSRQAVCQRCLQKYLKREQGLTSAPAFGGLITVSEETQRNVDEAAARAGDDSPPADYELDRFQRLAHRFQAQHMTLTIKGRRYLVMDLGASNPRWFLTMDIAEGYLVREYETTPDPSDDTY